MNQTRNNFNEFYRHALNPEQQEVVSPKDGVLLVCAGAGSGKTRVITARMAHLILNHEVRPQEIVALTFTNKAAREMKERIQKFLGNEQRLPYVGTFHSYCLKILKSNPHLLASGIFSLIDDSDQEKIVRALLSKHGYIKKIAVKQVLSFISKIKNEALTSDDKEELFSYDPILKDLYFAYEHQKSLARCLDFDDLLTHTLQLFEKYPHFKSLFQTNVRHILVDEYQDTNIVQHALLKAMSKDDQGFSLDSLCVVGDEDQSIYSWRGATVTNIINFSKDFPATNAITIEQNYRSVQPILNIANAIIQNNSYRNPKNLWSTRKALDRIRILGCMSSYQEGEVIALFLKQLQHSTKDQTHALLYRSHFQSRALEEALIRHGIPYKIIGGIQFYDRLEIKDLLSYLRLILNPYDRIAFSRIINSPQRGLGDKFEELFYTTWNEQPFLTFFDIAQQLLDQQKITKAKQDSLRNFISIFDTLSKEQNASDVVTALLQRTQYYSYLKENFEPEEAEIKRENIKEFLNGILYFEQTTQQNLEQFLEEVALLQEQMSAKETEEDQHVRLMTFHAAKGLEFDTVILVGLEEGILPSAHSIYQPENLEEERRLLYVGITRARERLFITHTKYRYTYGQMTEQRPSRFLDEIPTNLAPRHDSTNWGTYELTQYLTNWLHMKHTNPILEDEYPLQAHPFDEEQWYVNQTIIHANFGSGKIQKIEKKSDKIYITAQFKQGIKKIESSFVSAE